MTWTCEQTEARLSDYLDGVLQPAEQAAFDLHVNGCERCTPLVASVSHVLAGLRIELSADFENEGDRFEVRGLGRRSINHRASGAYLFAGH